MTRERLRADALAIGRAALRAVDPEARARAALRVPEPVTGRIVLLGAGKAAAAMAAGVEAALGDRLDHGVVVVKDGHGRPLRRTEVLEASHPVPDARSVAAGERLLAEARALGPDDLLIGVWSGGGSALAEAPADGETLASIAAATRALLASGADIAEINAERVRRSRLKGGGLARACAARIVNLVLSDVAGDDPARVASGPAVRPGDGTALIGRLADAVKGAVDEAFALRYATTVLDPEVRGEASEVGARLATAARVLAEQDGYRPPMALFCAGEPVVTGPLHGLGGRMQEAALSAARVLAGTDAVLLCLGTDGTDGPTDAAGALIDGGTWDRIVAAGIDPDRALRDHDAYPALDAAGDLVRTGPTGTNVRDLLVALIPAGTPQA